MKDSMLKNILLLLLIAFICRFAQDLFNPYISFDSYTNWKLWSLAFVDAVILTIELILGGAFYRNFNERRQNRINIITIICFLCCLVYTFIQQKAFISESAISIISIIIGAAWKTGLFMAGIVILIGIASFIYRKIKNARLRK